MRIVALVHTLVLPLEKGHMHCVQQLQQKQCLQSGVWTHRHGPCCSEAVPGLRRVQQARVTAR